MTLNRKILLFVLAPLALTMLAVGILIYNQANQLSHSQTQTLERGLINAKKAELRYYTAFALNSISSIYRPAAYNDEAAKAKVRSILSNLSYGPDGYFFVYDYEGNNIVHPRQSFRIGKNWWNLRDSKGNYVIRDLIKAAKKGGGYTEYVWEKPSAGKPSRKIGYAIGLDKWKWMIGTGLYTDNITGAISSLEKDITGKTTSTFILVAAIVFAAMAIIGAAGVMVTYQQHRIAKSQLQALNRRIIETQEDERARVARELHDGISQQLTSTKFIFELAQIQSRKPKKHNSPEKTIIRGLASLTDAISEIRRISRDLRPGMLDDLGLAPAITSLASEFSRRSGIKVTVDANPVNNLLSDDAKTALFRILQEALNNIIRHAGASQIAICLKHHNQNIVLTVDDNGNGFDTGSVETGNNSSRGIGLRNMRERVEYYNGEMTITSDDNGTTLVASIPVMSSTARQAAE